MGFHGIPLLMHLNFCNGDMLGDAWCLAAVPRAKLRFVPSMLSSSFLVSPGLDQHSSTLARRPASFCKSLSFLFGKDSCFGKQLSVVTPGGRASQFHREQDLGVSPQFATAFDAAAEDCN